MLTRLTDQTFNAAVRSSRPIMVVFTAPKRCPHCREQKPALEWLDSEGYPVYLVDVEEPDTAHVEATLGGQGVPRIKMYANGQLLTEHLGMLDADGLRSLFREGAQLAAEMGAHRPVSAPPPPAPAPQMVAEVGECPPGSYETHDGDCVMEGTLSEPQHAYPRAHSINGMLAGFGRGRR